MQGRKGNFSRNPRSGHFVTLVTNKTFDVFSSCHSALLVNSKVVIDLTVLRKNFQLKVSQNTTLPK